MHKNSQGLSLVELMIAIGLFGMAALAIMNLLVDTNRAAALQKLDSDVTDQVQEFSFALTTTLTNTTQGIRCGCGTDCIYTDSNECTTGTCSSTLFRFESENSADPSINNSASLDPNCVLSGSIPQGITLRGCKARYQLIYTPPGRVPQPIPNPPGNEPSKGTLALFREDAADQPTIAVSSISGVSRVWCGQTTSDQFRIQFETKTQTTLNRWPSALYDSFHPSDPSFSQGRHQTFKSDISFRNFNTPGAQFGKTSTTENCGKDGATVSLGAENCCSGYQSQLGVCVSMGQCKVRGSNAGANTECCSHHSTSSLRVNPLAPPTGGVCL